MKFLSLFAVTGGLVCCLACAAQAEQQYLGASALLQKAAESLGQSKTNEPPSEIQKLKNELKDFSKKSKTMAPEAAAKTWMSFLERFEKRSGETSPFSRSAETLTFTEVAAALPPPAAWDNILKMIESRPAAKGKDAAREIALRMFAHTLVNNPTARTNDIAAFDAFVSGLKRDQAMSYQSVLQQLRRLQIQNSNDPNAVLKVLEQELQEAGGARGYQQSVPIPDLIALIGREKTEVFLRSTLTNTAVELDVREGNETEQLARKLALELVDELKVAQWSLTHSLDATALYEALNNRFGKKAETKETAPSTIPASWNDNRSQQEARSYYLLGLIVQHRNQEAVTLVKTMDKDGRFDLPDDALKRLESTGHAKAIHDFFREMLTQLPDAPVWDNYIDLAAKVGETEKMLELVRATMGQETLSSKTKTNLRRHLFKALLAADQVDEGVKELRQLISTNQTTTPLDGGYLNPGLELARLGFLLQRPEWVEAGIRAGKTYVQAISKMPNAYYALPAILNFAGFLGEHSRGSEAEEVLLQGIVSTLKSQKDQYGGNSDSMRQLLIALIELYHKAGRPEDVLVLLDESPHWGAKDVVEFYTDTAATVGFRQHASGDPVGYFVASALAAKDRKDEARKLVIATLNAEGGFDPAYELLLKLDGEGAIPQLDKLVLRDRFEERPLIWKAILMQRANKLEQAEELARNAISIDPSDGEQGPGRRMRAYAVLADIREARGDKKQAEFFRGAVKAIRLSEDADRYYEAGLLKQAVAMYEKSLTLFADAYCIQSRLALRLSELGMHEEAEEHYRRAYELMPESFGRVESHCFGCEQAFAGEKAQGMAEKIFTQLAIKTPKKPQVHYLLGYLREEQGRHQEALNHFREAVKLDPDYLNAWSHIEKLGRFTRLPVEDRDAVTLNLLRLDPLNRHAYASANVSDLRALWTVLERAQDLNAEKPVALYPLAASKAELEKKKTADPDRDFNRFSYSFGFRNETEMNPAMRLLQNEWIGVTINILNSDYSRYDF